MENSFLQIVSAKNKKGIFWLGKIGETWKKMFQIRKHWPSIKSVTNMNKRKCLNKIIKQIRLGIKNKEIGRSINNLEDKH